MNNILKYVNRFLFVACAALSFAAYAQQTEDNVGATEPSPIYGTAIPSSRSGSSGGRISGEYGPPIDNKRANATNEYGPTNTTTVSRGTRTGPRGMLNRTDQFDRVVPPDTEFVYLTPTNNNLEPIIQELDRDLYDTSNRVDYVSDQLDGLTNTVPQTIRFAGYGPWNYTVQTNVSEWACAVIEIPNVITNTVNGTNMLTTLKYEIDDFEITNFTPRLTKIEASELIKSKIDSREQALAARPAYETKNSKGKWVQRPYFRAYTANKFERGFNDIPNMAAGASEEEVANAILDARTTSWNYFHEEQCNNSVQYNVYIQRIEDSSDGYQQFKMCRSKEAHYGWTHLVTGPSVMMALDIGHQLMVPYATRIPADYTGNNVFIYRLKEVTGTGFSIKKGGHNSSYITLMYGQALSVGESVHWHIGMDVTDHAYNSWWQRNGQGTSIWMHGKNYAMRSVIDVFCSGLISDSGIQSTITQNGNVTFSGHTLTFYGRDAKDPTIPREFTTPVFLQLGAPVNSTVDDIEFTARNTTKSKTDVDTLPYSDGDLRVASIATNTYDTFFINDVVTNVVPVTHMRYPEEAGLEETVLQDFRYDTLHGFTVTPMFGETNFVGYVVTLTGTNSTGEEVAFTSPLIETEQRESANDPSSIGVMVWVNLGEIVHSIVTRKIAKTEYDEYLKDTATASRCFTSNEVYDVQYDVYMPRPAPKPMRYAGCDYPVGTILPFATELLPAGWVECNGMYLSREQYSALADVLETQGWQQGRQAYESIQAEDAFQVPDLRGFLPISPTGNFSGPFVVGALGDYFNSANTEGAVRLDTEGVHGVPWTNSVNTAMVMCPPLATVKYAIKAYDDSNLFCKGIRVTETNFFGGTFENGWIDLYVGKDRAKPKITMKSLGNSTATPVTYKATNPTWVTCALKNWNTHNRIQINVAMPDGKTYAFVNEESINGRNPGKQKTKDATLQQGISMIQFVPKGATITVMHNTSGKMPVYAWIQEREGEDD